MNEYKQTLTRTALIRQTWLLYYNDYLRDKGIITEHEWRRMRRTIIQRTEKGV